MMGVMRRDAFLRVDAAQRRRGADDSRSFHSTLGPSQPRFASFDGFDVVPQAVSDDL